MLWHKRSKWAKLSLIMVLLVVVSVISSLIARTALFETTYQSDYKIAVIAPMTGKLSATGQAMRNGAELYARAINDAGGIEGQYIGVEVFDNKGEETATIDQTRKALADNSVIGIVGPWQAQNVAKVAELADEAHIPLMVISPQAQSLSTLHPSLFAPSFDDKLETQFRANYMRNVLQEKLVSIVYDSSAHGEAAKTFTETFVRFGIPLRHSWGLDATGTNLDADVKRIAEEIKTANDSDALYLAMD